MDASAYFAALRQEQTRLDKLYPDGFLYIISIKNLNANSTGGTVSQVSTRAAAKHLCEATARIAEASDVTDFEARGVAFNEKIKAEQFTRNRSVPGGSVNLVIHRP